MKDYRKAIADETEAIRLRAEKSFFYVVCGEAYDGLNEPPKALADYTERPTQASYWYGRAMAEVALGRAAEAQADTDKA